MAKMELIAIHRIAIGKPKSNGQLSYAEPGSKFEIDAETGEKLVADGAARKPEKGAPAPEDATPPEELERLSLLEEAKAAGVKGLRANSSTETIKAKLAELEGGDGDGDDDSGDGDGDDDSGDGDDGDDDLV